MWSAIKNVSALVDQGLTQANQFLEELDKTEEGEGEEGEEFAEGDGDHQGEGVELDTDVEEELDAVGHNESELSSSAQSEAAEDADGEFFTPLKAPSTTTGKSKTTVRTASKTQPQAVKGSVSTMLSQQSKIMTMEGESSHGEDASLLAMKTENARLQRVNEELMRKTESMSLQMATLRTEWESEMARYKEMVAAEAEKCSRAEAEVAHIKKVAVSPKVHKENVKMVEVLKKELSDIELEKSQLELKYQSELAVLLAEKQSPSAEEEVQRLQEELRAANLQLESVHEAEDRAETRAQSLHSQLEASELLLQEKLTSERELMELIKQREVEHAEEVNRLMQEDETRLGTVKRNLQSALMELTVEDHSALLIEATTLRSALLEAGESKLRLEEELFQCKSRLEEMEQERCNAVEELQERLLMLTENVRTLEAEKTDIAAQLEALTAASAASLVEVESQNKELITDRLALVNEIEALRDELQKTAEATREEIHHKDELIQTLQHEVQSSGSVEGMVLLAEGAEEEVTELKAELDALTARYRSDAEAWEAQESRVAGEVLALHAECERVQSELQELRERAAEREAEWSARVTSLESSIDADGPEPQQQQDEAAVAALREMSTQLQESQGAYTALESEVDHLREEVQKHQEAAELKQREITVLQTSQESEVAALHAATKEAHRRREELEKKLSIVQDGSEELRNKVAYLEESLSDNEQTLSRRLLEVEELNLMNVGLKQRVVELEEELQTRGESTTTAEIELKIAFTELDSRLQRLQGDKESLLAQVSEKNAEVVCLEADVAVSRDERDSLRARCVELATSLHEAEGTCVSLREDKDRLESEVQERIIVNATLSQELHEARAVTDMLKEQLLSAEQSQEALVQSITEQASKYETAIQVLEETLREKELKMRSDADALHLSESELQNTSATITALEAECDHLKVEMTSMLKLVEEKEAAFASLTARTEEAEGALATFETKKKRDLEFLRKQNENIANLQRQVEELKQAATESEVTHKQHVEIAEKKSAEAARQVQRLQEALSAAQGEVMQLKSQLAEALLSKETDSPVEVLSNYADSAVAQRIGDTTMVAATDSEVVVMQQLKADLLRSEEKLSELTESLAQARRERQDMESSLTSRVEELSRGAKVFQAKISALEEERERLEGELRTAQRSLAQANSEAVGKEWNVHRGSVASVGSTFADVEIGGGETEPEEAGKKEAMGTHWALLYAWSVVLSLIPTKGSRGERNRLGIALLVYVALIHVFLLRMWNQCHPAPHIS